MPGTLLGAEHARKKKGGKRDGPHPKGADMKTSAFRTMAPRALAEAGNTLWTVTAKSWGPERTEETGAALEKEQHGLGWLARNEAAGKKGGPGCQGRGVLCLRETLPGAMWRGDWGREVGVYSRRHSKTAPKSPTPSLRYTSYIIPSLKNKQDSACEEIFQR